MWIVLLAYNEKNQQNNLSIWVENLIELEMRNGFLNKKKSSTSYYF